MKLVLFDLDGTILLTDGAGRRAIHAALRESFGSVGPADHWFDGKTDPQIIRELMRAEGHEDHIINQRMEALLDRYLHHLEQELQSPSHNPVLLAGAGTLLDVLEERDDVMLGLLTGNLERGAHFKLLRVGVAPDRFRVGAFGSDHEQRSELPAIAQQRAGRLLGSEVAGSSVVVIGDTPADVLCGRGIGARGIGVATGRYSVEQLASHGASAVFQSLELTDAVMEAILAD
jgi:phosphoglycolate phosphatase-like HAD superfamily hydrolase